MSEKLHPTRITTLEPSEQLGRELLKLRYDLLLPVLEGMIKEANEQGNDDVGRVRLRLGRSLYAFRDALTQSKGVMSLIVEDLKPYIEEEKAEQGKLLRARLER